MSAPGCRLYLVTPPALDLETFPALLASALDAGDVACLQLRLKETDDETIRRAVAALRPVVEQRDVALILNDRADLAHQTGCDGVHIGQDDMSYREARRIVGEHGIVGVTCHDSRHLALEAAEQGADYVAFGAFFPTATKTPKAAADPSILEWWSTMTLVPCVAIGGITVENCRPLIEAGADFLAVVAGVWDYADGPVAAVQAFDRAMRLAID